MRKIVERLKLSQKILIAPVAIVIFLIGLAYISYSGLAKQKMAMRDIYEKRFKSYQETSRILGNMTNVHANIYKVISWAGADFAANKIDELAKGQITDIEKGIGFLKGILESESLTPEEKRLFQSALEKLIEYQKPATGVLDIASSDLNIATMYMGSADDKFQELHRELQELMKTEDRLCRENYDFSLSSISSTLRMSLIISVIAIFLSLLISIYMGKLITSHLKKIIEGLTATTDKVSSASKQVLSASKSLADGASEQAASLEETSSSLEEIASMTSQNADHAGQADLLMKDANQVVVRANDFMRELTVRMEDVSKNSEDTSKIVKTIDEVAFQTNLLALNAAVEAARAGSAGAGFAVVADEVRNLAMRTANSARSTADLIEGIVKKIKDGSGLVQKTDEVFKEVAVSATKVGELVAEIAAASHEQSQGIEQVNKAVAEMDKVVQQNAAGAEKNACASEEMSNQSDQLKGFVGDLIAVIDGKGKSIKSSAIQVFRFSR